MSPPLKKPTYHLRAFVACLTVILIALISVLFGVHMEAVTHGTGLVKVRDLLELRAAQAGLAELGWYETEFPCSDSRMIRVRLDRQGNGMSDPSQGDVRKFHRFCCPEGSLLSSDKIPYHFHKLESGDRLWPGQVMGSIRPQDLWQNLGQMLSPAAGLTPTSNPLGWPTSNPGWQVLKVCCEPGQAVRPGDVLAWLAPIDPVKGEALAWIAHVDVPEKHAAGLEKGLEVRLISVMYNQRLHGHAEGVVEKVEPLADAADNGDRRFQVQIKITQAPFQLHHGMSVKAEIILGHKRVSRIILEH